MARLTLTLLHSVWWNYPFTKGKTIFIWVFLFQHQFKTNPTIFESHLRSTEYWFDQFFVFSGHRQVEISSINAGPDFSGCHSSSTGLFGIQLIVYLTLSYLTEHEIYNITQCAIWLLTIFHIFQRELRKVTPLKLYLSFFVQYTFHVVKITRVIYTHRQKLSNTTIFRRHCFGRCRMEYVGNGNQIF